MSEHSRCGRYDSSPWSPCSRRRGFTVVEMLVAVAIVGLLLALLLPAIQYARESGRRLACQANLRQLGVAMHGYCVVHGRFPAPKLYTVGGSTISDRSAHIGLLPFLGEAALFDSINLEIRAVEDRVAAPSAHNQTARLMRLALFLCPSDPASVELRNSYRFCAGSTIKRFETGAFSGLAGRRTAEIGRGLSKTAFASERFGGSFATDATYDSRVDVMVALFDQPKVDALEFLDRNCNPRAADFWRVDAGRYWYFYGPMYTAYFHDYPPNDLGPTCDLTRDAPGGFGRHFAASYHSGIVNLLHGDGSVAHYSDAIDLGVWRNLALIKEY